MEPVIDGQAPGVQRFVHQTHLREQQLHQHHCAHHGHDVGKQDHGLEKLVLLAWFFSSKAMA